MILIGYWILLVQIFYIVNIFLGLHFELLWHMTIIIMLIFLNWFIICNKKWNMWSFFSFEDICQGIVSTECTTKMYLCWHFTPFLLVWSIRYMYLKILNCQLYLKQFYLVSCIDGIYIYIYIYIIYTLIIYLIVIALSKLCSILYVFGSLLSYVVFPIK